MLKISGGKNSVPELPEVETIRYDLDKILSGYRIVNLWCDTKKMIQPSESMVKKKITGLKIDSFRRRAKLMIVKLENNDYLLIHLKMTGRLLIRTSHDPEDRWSHVILFLEKNGTKKELRFADQRKFGYMKLVDKKELQHILSNFGPEPLDNLYLHTFTEILSSKKLAVKKVLMDQKLISGIGNIYANDALFLAKIHPETPAKKINKEKTKRLFQSIEKVLKKGLQYRGASDNSYLDAFGIKGKYQDHFLVYRKEKEKCPTCDTKIKRIKLGGRGTFYCPSCQRR